MQRFLSRAGIAASVFLVAACAGDRPLAPDLAAPSLSVGVASTTELTCAWNTLDQTAKALFNSNQDPVFTTISAMRTAHRNGGASAATDLGFDVLRHAEVARAGSGRIKSGATGTQADAFTKAVFACTSHNVIPSSMNVASAWSQGVYGVRGGAAGSGDNTVAAKSIGPNPKFGAEAPQGWAATSVLGASRYLIWGAFVPNPFGGEAVSNSFHLETHPTVSFVNPIRVGVCLDPVSNTGQHRRLIHGASTGTKVGILSLVQFCSNPGDFAALTQSTGFFATVSRALSIFAPQQAFAQSRGGVGSLETSLSPFGSFTLDAATTEITWVQEPISGTKAGVVQNPAIAIDFLTNAGAPIAGITFEARIFNNNGQPSQTGSTGFTATTGANGRATFSNLTIASPGAYILEIYSAVTTEYVTSLRFNISP